MSLLEDAMRTAAVCGLATVKEAVLNMELHASQFMRYGEIPAYLEKLHAEHAAWTGGENIPDHIIEEERQRIDIYVQDNP